MHVLVLGGTQFVGRHIVEALLARGHDVSILNRGQTPDPLPACVERLRGNREAGEAGLAALEQREWDACVDVSGYWPRQVRCSAEALQDRVRRYVFVSAVSVYGDPRETPVAEDCPRVPAANDEVVEIDQKAYGELKVACEDEVQCVFGKRYTLLRPQIVAGPYDPLDRLSYWVRRAMQPGRMLAPGHGSDHLQFIDARDVARFAAVAIEENLSGAFNLSGPRLTWRDFLQVLEAQDLAWVPCEIIRAAGVGESQLPLYRRDGDPRSSLMHVDNRRALKAGLRLTDIAKTVAFVKEWLPQCSLESALPAELEAQLIATARLQL